ncbi:MAG: AAA family ATPase [Rectinemataceae bacterium]
MYIKRIELRNIRGFKQLDFNLDRGNDEYAGWTVITGDNGSGKSSLLKAIAICLAGKDTARALQPSFVGWLRSGAGDDESSITLEIVSIKADDNFVERGKTTDLFKAKVQIKASGKEPSLETPIPPGFREPYKTPDRSIWSSDVWGWFSCGYGPFRRVFGASSEATQQMVSSNTARYATMFNEAASLIEADRWIRDLNYKAKENRPREKKYLDSIMNMLKDEFIPLDLSVERIDSDGLWLKDKSETLLSWKDMSDGYRAALALLVDILRHMLISYDPNDIFSQDAEGHIVVDKSGVVLIDEIDAHLHPEWQRKIGFWLKNHFPKIQFLVTTHSPIICQAADRNGIFKLPDPGSDQEPSAVSEEEYKRIIAGRSDTILLTSAFGLENTRSEPAVEKRQEYSKLKAIERSGAILSLDQEAALQQSAPYAEIDEEL